MLTNHIADDIMSQKKLNKIRQEMTAFRRRGGIKSVELESLAKELGRTRSNRGSEPTWVNLQFPELRPLSIPHHSGDLNRHTAGSILDQLELDVERWDTDID